MSSSASETLENETPSTPSTSNPPPPHEFKNLENQTPTVSNPPLDNKTLENQKPGDSDQSNVSNNGEDGEGGGGEGEEDEEEGECGFCLFMKGGGCKDSFIAWEKCVEEAEKNKEDVVEKCFEVTALLKKCMDAHADYYEPILGAEKALEEEVARELKREAVEKEKQEN